MKAQILTLSVLAALVASPAMANYKLASNGKTVSCDAGDNTTVTLNAKRTTIKYEVEGESNGPEKITKAKSNNKDTVRYTCASGVLTLSDKGDTYLYNGDQEATPLDCQ